MATKTIGQLDEVLSAAPADMLEIEQASGNLSKRITKANLIGGAITGGGTIATGGNNLTIGGPSTINGSLLGGGALSTGGFTLTIPASGNAALKSGTPVAGRVASWLDANTLQDGGFAVSDIARLSAAQTFALLQTFAAGINVGQDTLNFIKADVWTPTLGSDGSAPTVTYSTQVGHYLRVNTTVFFTFQININTISGGSGNAQLVGLPFNFGATSDNQGFIRTSGADWPSGTSTFLSPVAGTNRMYMNAFGDNINSATIAISGFAAGDVVSGFGIYSTV